MRGANGKDWEWRVRVLAVCWLATVCAGAQSDTAMVKSLPAANFVRHQVGDSSGIYQGRAATKDPARRVFTLTLLPGGTAIFTTLYIGKHDAIQHARWSQAGIQIVLTFDALGSNQPPRPITFRLYHHALRPIGWDASEWGRSGPPILHYLRTIAAGV